MGGKALKTMDARRMPAAEYHPFAARVAARLRARWPNARPYVIPAYETKPDFGDLDVLVDRAGVPDDALADLAMAFGSREVIDLKTTIALEVEGFQVDLIMVQSESYPCAAIYFAYNDAGNLLGRVARAMGFKFGFDGLTYLLRVGDRLIAEIVLSRDPRAILEFLGYDYEAFVYGFQALEDMFAYVASSPYFDPSRYALEARNHAARVRDRKRPSYRAFLAWLDATNPPAGTLAGQERTAYLERASRFFPRFPAELAEAMTGHTRQLLRRNRFNGHIVAEVSGFTGPRLGALVQEVRNGFPGGQGAFDAWLDTGPSDVAVREAIASGVARMGAGQGSAPSTIAGTTS